MQYLLLPVVNSSQESLTESKSWKCGFEVDVEECALNLPGDGPGCVEGVFRSLRLPDPWGKKTNPLSSQGGTEVTEVTVGQG